MPKLAVDEYNRSRGNACITTICDCGKRITYYTINKGDEVDKKITDMNLTYIHFDKSDSRYIFIVLKSEEKCIDCSLNTKSA